MDDRYITVFRNTLITVSLGWFINAILPVLFPQIELIGAIGIGFVLILILISEWIVNRTEKRAETIRLSITTLEETIETLSNELDNLENRANKLLQRASTNYELGNMLVKQGSEIRRCQNDLRIQQKRLTGFSADWSNHGNKTDSSRGRYLSEIDTDISNLSSRTDRIYEEILVIQEKIDLKRLAELEAQGERLNRLREDDGTPAQADNTESQQGDSAQSAQTTGDN